MATAFAPLLVANEKVVIFGDTHANIPAFFEVVRFAVTNGCWLIISAGDFGYLPQLSAGREFIEAVHEMLEQYDLNLIVIDGNHDDHWALAELETDEHGMGVIGPRTRHAKRGVRFFIGETSFLAAGGAYSIDRYRRTTGLDWWPEELISFSDANACIDGGPADVIISHDCPHGVAVGIGENKLDVDSLATRKTLRAICEAIRPKMLFHGHHHLRASRELVLDDGTKVQVEGLGRDGQGSDLYVLFDPALV